MILRWRAHKGRNRYPTTIEIPILQPLAEVLADPRCDSPDAMTFLTTDAGVPFSSAGFGNWFRDRCNEAGLPHCSAHGLRKASATRAAENGASENQLMAMYGWRTSKEAQHYVRAAERKRLAASGMVHLLKIKA
jgi:integrase